MNRNRVIYALLAGFCLVAGCTSSGSGERPAGDAVIAAAITDQSRYPEHVERDPRSRPDEILRLLNLRPGDTVADILGGGGYYAELLRRVVGANGTVILQNNTPYMKFVEKSLEERYGDGQVPNLRVLKSEVDNLGLESGSLDAALMVMSYHDLYYVNPDRGWGNTDVLDFFTQVRTALKPGGRLVIVDHAAKDGSGISDTPEIHRIDEAFAKADIQRSGLRLIATSDVLRNPNDARDKMVFDKSIRGETDRFVLVFEK